MKKPLGTLVLLLAVLVLGGCDSPNPPTPSDTMTGGESGMGPYNADGQSAYSESGLDPSARGQGLSARDTHGLGGKSYRKGDFDPKDLVVSIYFDFDNYSVRATERQKLTDVARQLQSDPNLKLVAAGHTDWYGTAEYNLVLGDKRASSVRAFLQQLGVAPDRIEVLSYGKLDATANVPKTSTQAKEDRRVDLIKAK